MGTSVRLPIIAGLPLMAVRSALLEWSRAAELSCDRAAALVTRDPEAVCRTLMVLAAGAEAEELDLAQFMAQAQDYDSGGTGLERLSRMFIDLNITHPMPVRRAQELMAWVRSGEYDRIVGGEYLRRGEEAGGAQRGRRRRRALRRSLPQRVSRRGRGGRLGDRAAGRLAAQGLRAPHPAPAPSNGDQTPSAPRCVSHA